MASTISLQDFSEDIIIEIIARLPIRLVFHFMCLSKSFYSLIQSPLFKSTLTARQKSSKNVSRYIGYMKGIPSNSIRLFNDEAVSSFQELKIPQSLPQRYRYVGSCNGLVCLMFPKNIGESESRAGNICLWNPMIWKVKILPKCLTQYQTGVDFAFGCYEKRNIEYKVVRFVYFNHTGKCHVEVYSLRSDIWRRIRNVNQSSCGSFSIDGDSCVSVNGYVHWLAAKGRNMKTARQADFVAAFDLDCEVMREIPLPESVDGFLTDVSIGKFHESIALVHHLGISHGIFSDFQDIWVFQGFQTVNSQPWIKKFNLRLFCSSPFPPRKGITRETISFSKDGKAALVAYIGEMRSYELENMRVKNLGITGYPQRPLDTFEDSLVLLDCKNTVPGFAMLYDKNSYSFPVCTIPQKERRRKKPKVGHN